MIVSIECFLEYFLVQKLHMLLNLLTILIAPFSVSVSGIEVVSLGRNEGRCEPLVQEIIPREVPHPGVVLDVLWPVQA